MTVQTESNRHVWQRMFIGGVAGGALAVGLLAGAPSSIAQPDTPSTTTAPTPAADAPKQPCTGDDCKKPDPEAAQPTMTADQALQIIATEYDTGAGGGQLSNLIHDVLKLRAQGFRPSNANRLAIEEALNHRPNQAPLVAALEETRAYQRKQQAQAAMSTKGSGAGSGGPVPVYTPPSGSVQLPAGPGNAGITIPIG
jgi:hypothetical protein